MPTLDGVISDPIGWLQHTWPWLVVLSIGAWLIWRFTRPVLHRLVWGALRVHGHASGGALPDEELRKRADTIEQLLASIVRFAIVLGIVFAILGFFDLWSAVAGLGLLGAALTVAGQSIVLDYLMGVLILLEGQYYTGDTIAAGGVEGLVEEVGLRRTVIRDVSGTVHSVSNGQIRTSSNLTRIHAMAVVDLPGIVERHVETTIALMDRVGEELAADPAWAPRLLETPHYVATTAFTDLGLTLRMTGSVRAADRWAVAAELRRRLAPALREAGVEPNRRVLPG